MCEPFLNHKNNVLVMPGRAVDNGSAAESAMIESSIKGLEVEECACLS